MNLRTRQFIREYLIDLNGSAAARRAGYSPRSAGRRAFELLERPEVKAAVRAAMAARARRTNVTADRVLEEFARIAFADLRRVSDWGPGGFRLKPSARLADADAAAVAWVSTGGRNASACTTSSARSRRWRGISACCATGARRWTAICGRMRAPRGWRRWPKTARLPTAPAPSSSA